VTVRYTPPEIEDDKIEILVNPEKLKERTEEAFRTHQGNTQGMKPPLPIDVLKDLRAYVRNAWDRDPNHRAIRLSNKRFVVRFGPGGEACREVLEALGFRLDQVSCTDIALTEICFWQLTVRTR
jgi:ubiquitin carboxyl-terminal hydrolase 25